MNLFRKKGTWASTPGSKSPFTIVGFDYFRNRCHGGDRDLHDYGYCSSEFSWSSLDYFDCDCGFFALAYLPSSLLNLHLASLQPEEPIVTSMPFLRVSCLDCRLVDCDGIYDSRIRGGFRLGCLFQGLVGQSWLESADGFKRDF